MKRETKNSLLLHHHSFAASDANNAMMITNNIIYKTAGRWTLWIENEKMEEIVQSERSGTLGWGGKSRSLKLDCSCCSCLWAWLNQATKRNCIRAIIISYRLFHLPRAFANKPDPKIANCNWFLLWNWKLMMTSSVTCGRFQRRNISFFPAAKFDLLSKLQQRSKLSDYELGQLLSNLMGVKGTIFIKKEAIRVNWTINQNHCM